MGIPGINKPNWKVALGIPAFIFLSCFLVTFTPAFKNNTGLFSNAILVDLLVSAPLVYLLAIRKSTISKITVSRIFAAGIFMAGLILKTSPNTLFQIVKTWISPLTKGMVIFFIARKFHGAVKNAKQANSNRPDFLIHCRNIMYQLTGNEKAGNILSSEIAVLYYAFLAKRDKTINYKTKFSTYKETGLLIVFGVILSIFLIETTAVHLLLSLWNKTIAWVLTGLSLYTCVQLYAHIKAIQSRPVIINEDSLEIHNGLAGDAYIRFDNIEKIELSNKIPADRDAVKIALLKNLENHNVVVYLKKPVRVTKMFGIVKEADAVLFYIDKSKDFSIALNTSLSLLAYSG